MVGLARLVGLVILLRLIVGLVGLVLVRLVRLLNGSGRAAEGAGLTERHSLLAHKLRTSGCGALSIWGGLAALHVTLWRTRGRRVAAAVNFALHVYVSCLSSVLLPLLSHGVNLSAVLDSRRLAHVPKQALGATT